jgi:hypothetical protein
MQTFFANYESRLQALAMRQNLESAVLKGLVEDAFGKCDTPPAEQEANTSRFWARFKTFCLSAFRTLAEYSSFRTRM